MKMNNKTHYILNLKHFKLGTAILGSVLMWAGCNRPPKEYSQGLDNMKAGKYAEAIEHFNAVDEDEWMDSASTRKLEAWEGIIHSGKWKTAFKVLKSNESNHDFMDSAEELTANYLGAVHHADSALTVLDKYGSDFGQAFDSSFVRETIDACEDRIFKGTWYGEGVLKAQEIHFERQGRLICGMSSKTFNGWTKNSIIYKNLTYSSNLQWKMQPKVFQESYWQSTTTYYGKKGTVTLLTADTILVDYESLGTSARFHREQ